MLRRQRSWAEGILGNGIEWYLRLHGVLYGPKYHQLEDLDLPNGEHTNKHRASSSSLYSSNLTSQPTSMSLGMGVGVWIGSSPWVGANVVSSSQRGWEGDKTSFLLILVTLICLWEALPQQSPEMNGVAHGTYQP